MVYSNIRVKIHNDRDVSIFGHDMGAPVTLEVDFGDYQIWKVRGHTGWAGRCLTRYYSTQYMLVQVKAWDAKELHCTLIRREEPGHFWRHALTDLTEEARLRSGKDQSWRALKRALASQGKD